MVQVKHYDIYSPLSIRKRALVYANRPTPKYLEKDIEAATPKELAGKQLAAFLDDHFGDRAEMGIVSKGRYGATVGNLTESVKICLHLNIDNHQQKIKLSDSQKDYVDGVCRLVISWLFLSEQETFGPTSRADLTAQQVHALGKWSTEFKDGEYVERLMYRDELTWVIYWANRAWNITKDALAAGDNILFGDILQRYTEETIAGEQDADYWDLSVMTSIETLRNAEPQVAEQKETADPGLPDGAVWCELCGEVPTAIGEPCKACKKLGATKEMLMQYPAHPAVPAAIETDAAAFEGLP